MDPDRDMWWPLPEDVDWDTVLGLKEGGVYRDREM